MSNDRPFGSEASIDAKTWALAAVGALVGAAIGYWIFRMMLNYGLYAAAIPGSFVGLGAGFPLRRRNTVVGIGAGILGLIVGVLSDFERTVGHNGFVDYLQNQSIATYVMLALGGACGYWFGVGRDR